MKEYNVPSDERNIQGGLDRLIEDLEKLKLSGTDIPEKENNSLSLMVDEALNGVDIRKRYPAFYAQLLKSFSLRQQFLDAILLLKEPVLAETKGLYTVTRSDLAFLHTSDPASAEIKLSWPVVLEQTRDQLMAVFFPPQLSFRSGAPTLAEPHYTLLRSEFTVDQTCYTLIVESTLHETRDDVLSLFINVAVTGGEFQPMQASLNWGAYFTRSTINSEGRIPLPDVPISAVFDANLQKIESDLKLTLTSAA